MRRPLLFTGMILAGCAGRPPIVLPAQFEPPHIKVAPAAPGPQCRLHIAEVHDARDDTHFMGQLGDRPVRATDSVAWVRSGLASLSRNSRIVLEGTDAPDVEARVDLIKGYVQGAASTKTANVVLVASLHSGREPDSRKTYRGGEEGPDWAASEEEALGILNLALADALRDIAADVLARCGPIQKPGS